jgi:SAM-dependent methyltransferase
MKVNIINPDNGKLLSEGNNSLIDKDGNEFPLINGAYRFVSDGNYTSNFGFQWNAFQKTQIDGQTNSSQSKDRFLKVTSWDKLNLENENILEVGSGAGRFTQVALQHTKANIYSVDYSNAVEANFRNNGHYPRLKLFQASIYELPFQKESFDRVFCFGVLQHTPDFKQSVKSLIEMVKPGGELIVDFYPIKGWWTKIHAKYIFRIFTKSMDQGKLLRLIENNVDWMISLTHFFDRIGVGRFLNRFIPICDIKNTIPITLNKKELREWIVLDTFDMFSPRYDNPQKLETVKRWFKEFGMKNVFADFISYNSNNQVAVVKGKK